MVSTFWRCCLAGSVIMLARNERSEAWHELRCVARRERGHDLEGRNDLENDVGPDEPIESGNRRPRRRKALQSKIHERSERNDGYRLLHLSLRSTDSRALGRRARSRERPGAKLPIYSLPFAVSIDF